MWAALGSQASIFMLAKAGPTAGPNGLNFFLRKPIGILGVTYGKNIRIYFTRATPGTTASVVLKKLVVTISLL